MDMSTRPLAEVKAHPSKPSAVQISLVELESLQETIAVLSDQPLVQQLLTSETEISQGQGETLEELTAAMHERKRSSRVS